ncbi:hypothetical protein M0805_004788 [Coniferiporia weirii]|nr:hypothetical protein M0805_004788 [Coniferiporia weirii]
MPGSSTGPFSFGQRLGTVFIIQAACLSLISVTSLLVYILFSALVRNTHRRWTLSTPLHIYFISMMFSEILQATGSIMDLRWVINAGVTSGSYCVAQGMLKQIGDVSVALSTLAIAVHTFCAVVLRWRPSRPRAVSALVLAAIWVVIAIIIVVSVATHANDLPDYWGNTEYWCWITKRYKVQQYMLDYVFMWATAFANIILYIPLSLVIKGIIIVDGNRVKIRSKKDRTHTVGRPTSEPCGRGVDSIAMQMLFYPLVYTLTVLPIAIVRLRAFNNKEAPFAITVVADVLFSCSGFFNVVLFKFTRPALLSRRGSSSAYPTTNAISLSLRSPVGDRHFSVGRPSLLPERSSTGGLPDNGEVYRYESQSYKDHSRPSPGAEFPTKVSPSISSFLSQA